MTAAGELPLIVSLDDHVVEPPHLWTSRLPKALVEDGPRVVRDRGTVEQANGATVVRRGSGDQEFDFWQYGSWSNTIPMVMACAGFDPSQYTMGPISFAEMRPGCYEPKARLADMDADHTQAQMCFPNSIRFCGQVFLDGPDKDLGLLCVRAYNDFIVEEWCAGSGGRLVPLCIIPLWDPALAADEVRRNAARGVRAVCFTELPPYLGLPSIHSGHWDPFFAACNETGTVIFMHIGSGSRLTTSSKDAPQGVVIALTFSNAQVSITDWLLSGVLVRYPNLKIVYSESQVGWMPFLLERIDKMWVNSGAWAGVRTLVPEPPSTYVPGRVFGTFFDDDTGIENRHRIGVGQMMFETDYPHQDSAWPKSADVVARFAPELSPEELERIVRGNAIDLLQLTFT